MKEYDSIKNVGASNDMQLMFENIAKEYYHEDNPPLKSGHGHQLCHGSRHFCCHHQHQPFSILARKSMFMRSEILQSCSAWKTFAIEHKLSRRFKSLNSSDISKRGVHKDCSLRLQWLKAYNQSTISKAKKAKKGHRSETISHKSLTP